MPSPYDHQEVIIVTGRRTTAYAEAYINFDTSPSWRFAVVRQQMRATSNELTSTHEILISSESEQPAGRIWWQSTIKVDGKLGIRSYVQAPVDVDDPGREPANPLIIAANVRAVEMVVRFGVEELATGCAWNTNVIHDTLSPGEGGEHTRTVTLRGPGVVFSGAMRIALHS